MRRILKAAAGVALAVGFGAAVPLVAGAAPHTSAPGAVFVQTDNPGGNQVVAYDRAATGTLGERAVYDTGGQGGVLNGSVVDHLASQGSLALDASHDLLFAVNAGSDTVSVFQVDGDTLALRQVLPSGGTFPVSVAVHGDFVYVLNALGGGSVSGFRAAGGKLHPINGSARPLGLTTPGTANQFTHTPGQVAFTPAGTNLLVTTKAAGNSVDVFAVEPNGRLSASPVVNVQPPTTVPFALTFDPAGRVVLTEAGPNAVATLALGADGSLERIDAVTTHQSATCWIAGAGGNFFVSNAGSSSLTGIAETATGTLSTTADTTTDAGTVDAAATPDGSDLYVQTGGSGYVDEFAVGAGGSLTEVGKVLVAGAAGGEGIVAS